MMTSSLRLHFLQFKFNQLSLEYNLLPFFTLLYPSIPFSSTLLPFYTLLYPSIPFFSTLLPFYTLLYLSMPFFTLLYIPSIPFYPSNPASTFNPQPFELSNLSHNFFIQFLILRHLKL